MTQVKCGEGFILSHTWDKHVTLLEVMSLEDIFMGYITIYLSTQEPSYIRFLGKYQYFSQQQKINFDKLVLVFLKKLGYELNRPSY